jgi:uncharacterized membrane protein YgdD (TMEM256/DUF423 family)
MPPSSVDEAPADRRQSPASRGWIAAGAISGFIAVAAGAFGAHSLKTRLPIERLEVFETAARYQLIHSLSLVTVGVLASMGWRSAALGAAGWAFAGGTVLFSGSLYALALSGERALGAVTPFGGLGLLAGWASLAIAALSRRP